MLSVLWVQSTRPKAARIQLRKHSGALPSYAVTAGQGNGEWNWKACCEAKMPFRRAMLKLACKGLGDRYGTPNGAGTLFKRFNF